MKAVAVEEFGGTPRLMELSKPAPAPGEVLVRLVAASLNPFDRAVFDGFLRHLPHAFPLVIGFDGAGVVEEVGDGVERFEVGSDVYGSFAQMPLGKGTLAEYIAISDDALIDIAPRRIPLLEAAATPGAGMTAVGLIDDTGVSAGQTVLIVGAGGGVGGFAVQLASIKGAEVLATARSDSTERLRSLGAAETLDYGRGPIAERVREFAPGGVDVLLDLVSDPESFSANVELVRDGGRAVSLRYAAQEEASASGRVDVGNFSLREHPKAKEFLVGLGKAIDNDGLQVTIEAELSLEEAPAAIAKRELRGARGKTVIKI